MDEINSIDKTCVKQNSVKTLNAAKGRQCLYQSDRTTVFTSLITEKACYTSVRKELWEKSSYSPN